MVTTSHKWDDSRIFWLEALTLLEIGVEVTILAINDESELSEVSGIGVVALGCRRRRLGRFLVNPIVAFEYCRKHSQEYDVLHVHDSELMPWIGRLRRTTKLPVVYDMHEFASDVLKTRSWVPSWLRSFAVMIAHILEKHAFSSASAVVAVNEIGETHALQLGAEEVAVFMGVPSRYQAEQAKPCDSGRAGVAYTSSSLSQIRGADIIAAVAPRLLESDQCRVIVAGPPGDEVGLSVTGAPGVDYRGVITRPEVLHILNQAAVGWLPERRTPNHEKAWSVKLGEYMAAGLPVVTTDLGYCSRIVAKYDCGIVVDSDDDDDHLMALQYLIRNPLEARRMGSNGRQAILEDLNSEMFALELRRLYMKLVR
jgi:glycosyltransferase involved in cell wall biosynthesis